MIKHNGDAAKPSNKHFEDSYEPIIQNLQHYGGQGA
jgi:hypothetical protein